jgi:hypothetical protein
MTICALLLAASLTAQSRDQGQYDVKEPLRVATAALPTLRDLAEKVPTVIGLTAGEAASAQLGQPLQLFVVGLDALKRYTSGADPRALLQDVRTVHYPILVGGVVRSSLAVKQKPQGWVATDFGQVELAKRVAAARGAAAGEAFLVRVPALNTYFVGTTSGGSLQLIPIADVPGTNLRANQPAPADAVFNTLAARARASNGLPT